MKLNQQSRISKLTDSFSIQKTKKMKSNLLMNIANAIFILMVAMALIACDPPEEPDYYTTHFEEDFNDSYLPEWDLRSWEQVATNLDGISLIEQHYALKCAADDLGNYAISPVYDLTGIGEPELLIEISQTTMNPLQTHELYVYATLENGSMPWTQIAHFEGFKPWLTDKIWHEHRIDLSDFAGKRIKIKFVHGHNDGINGIGPIANYINWMKIVEF